MGRSIPWDAVLSLHTNGHTCGVAKFNVQLAAQLGIPCLPLTADARWPLISIKTAEFDSDWREVVNPARQGDLLLHDRPMDGIAWPGRVWFADDIGCPSTLIGNRGPYRVLTFGMAHKRVLPHFAALKDQLEREHPNYLIGLSTAVHEGSPWDQSMRDAEEGLREIFGDRLRFLGFLADDALAEELHQCDAVAMYFTPALRKNNTSYWAAVKAGKTIYTNRDELSPKEGDPPVTWDSVIEALCAS